MNSTITDKVASIADSIKKNNDQEEEFKKKLEEEKNSMMIKTNKLNEMKNNNESEV